MILVFDTDSLGCSVQCAVDVMQAHGVDGVCTNAPFMVFKGASIADLAQVVRCRDCKHSQPWYGDKRLCYLWNDEYGHDVFEDGFCSYGEREAEA